MLQTCTFDKSLLGQKSSWTNSLWQKCLWTNVPWTNVATPSGGNNWEGGPPITDSGHLCCVVPFSRVWLISHQSFYVRVKHNSW